MIYAILAYVIPLLIGTFIGIIAYNNEEFGKSFGIVTYGDLVSYITAAILPGYNYISAVVGIVAFLNFKFNLDNWQSRKIHK